MTRSTPLRRTIMSSGEIFLTLARTFIVLKPFPVIVANYNKLPTVTQEIIVKITTVNINL
jgi:hypothetical protein